MIVLNVNVNDMRWLAHAATSRFKLWQNKDIFLTITHSYTQKFKLWLSKGNEILWNSGVTVLPHSALDALVG